MSISPIKRALISVSDKHGLTEFARGLASAGVEILSTGGTRRHLETAGIAVRDVAEHTGFPEMMDGRLKTLHPKVHGGILARRDQHEDLDALAEHGISLIDLIVVSLYPFAQTVAKAGVTDEEAIEQIDIGGPTMIRAAAKNHRFVTLATAPQQYGRILEEIASLGGTTYELRRELAGAAFEMTAVYDRAIADYFARGAGQPLFPARLSLTLERESLLRYGENPHQQAALYARVGGPAAALVHAEKLHGKELSFNNLLDLDSAWAIARSLPSAAAVIIKHNNPCGAAAHPELAVATRSALDGDPVSAFGAVIGFNAPVDEATALVLAEPGRFVEAIVAPDYSASAREILTTKPKWKDNVRLLRIGDTATGAELQLRHIDGGMLAQQADSMPDPETEWRVVTETTPTDEQLADLRFAWAVCRHVKSNAIVLGKQCSIIGVGAGQMSRVDSVEIAIQKAGDRATGSVLASDAFFPFDDSIHRAAAAGIAAIIQPGGSRRDDDAIAACNQHGLSMIFTNRRHFKH